MAEVLFIKPEDVKKYSVISGNMDDDKLLQWIKIAQDTHVQNYLGTDLFARLQAGVTAADLTSAETDLLNDYIKDMVIHWAIVEILGYAPYTISNKGVYKHSSENAETVSKEEVDSLIERHRNIAQSYSRRFVDYMCYNESAFPQYTSNTDEDVKPSTSTDFNTWVL